jgi:hypothetical protein
MLKENKSISIRSHHMSSDLDRRLGEREERIVEESYQLELEGHGRSRPEDGHCFLQCHYDTRCARSFHAFLF